MADLHPDAGPAAADVQQLRALRRALSNPEGTPASALCAALRISQPTLSRLLRRAGAEVLTFGRARSTRYALRRQIEGVQSPLPIYEVGANSARHIADLHGVAPEGYYLESRVDDVESRCYPDLPWFLHDLRPAGFLGRQLPVRHPELALPADVRLWSGDHALRFLSRHGWDGVGALIVGSEACARFLAERLSPPAGVSLKHRAQVYEQRAEVALIVGPAGSSAGGEQPKFLANRDDGDRLVPVLVKFSPPGDDPVSRRRAELLIAEHHALRTLADFGRSAASSELIFGPHRVFLELERFDRVSSGGRIGLVSLFAVDAEFVGRLGAWSETSQALWRDGLISEADHRGVRWLERFGQLIANDDMHPANLSFRLSGTRIVGLAPAYDMLPMAYFPASGELRRPPFSPPLPSPDDADIAAEVVTAAMQFWGRVAGDGRVGDDFRAIAETNLGRVGELAAAIAWLPR